MNSDLSIYTFYAPSGGGPTNSSLISGFYKESTGVVVVKQATIHFITEKEETTFIRTYLTELRQKYTSEFVFVIESNLGIGDAHRMSIFITDQFPDMRVTSLRVTNEIKDWIEKEYAGLSYEAAILAYMFNHPLLKDK